MGGNLSAHAEALPVTAPARPGPRTAGYLPPAAAAIAGKQAQTTKIDYQNLPCPVKYEELQREIMMGLKPDLFEGMKFEFNRPLNMNFGLTHNLQLATVDLPPELLGGAVGAAVGPPKASLGRYEFGANLVTSSGNMLIGRIANDGSMTGRIKYDLTDWASFKAQMSLVSEEGASHVMGDVDLKGKDWNSQLKVGHGGFYGMNYLQSVTPELAAGGEIFWLSQQRKSGVGLALRHAAPKHVATAQVATTGLLSLSYLHRVTEKVSLATDFMWNWQRREPSASVGYDYMLRQCRLRGRIDSSGRIGAYLEEKINMGVNLVLSAEIDHRTRDYKFGFGLVVGE